MQSYSKKVLKLSNFRYMFGLLKTPRFGASARPFIRSFHASWSAQAKKSFLLADIGEGITECEVIQWFVEPGSMVNEFDKICEVQSDKASVEISSRFSGKVIKLHHELHDIAKVGAPLVDIETEGEDEDEVAEEVIEEKPKADKVDVTEERKPASLEIPTPSVLATPAVRRFAKDNNVDLSKVRGTGKEGRILKEDVLESKKPKVVEEPKMPEETKVAGERTESLSMIQKAMFKSMTQSLAIPQLGYKDDIELDATTQYRASLNQHLANNPSLYDFKKMSYLPIFVKCLSIALTHYPIMNAKLDGDQLVYRSAHNIGIAMDSPQGLMVPNIKHVQQKTIFDIAGEIHRLQQLAAKNSLTMGDLKGGTITLSNIGTIGGTYANPVIVSSELAICALGRMQRLPRYEGDLIVPKQIMPVSWSADHRVIDGATIARFGNHWKHLIENPALLASELR
ncbi:2-oxoacid dehydrogenases acyltransferase-domain-containing protein [Sporodiniella umbellata]|nr:2-oxoacid dehydrogenases acyltransferase-domain-containing protein [Sporodiniella umbellata]